MGQHKSGVVVSLLVVLLLVGGAPLAAEQADAAAALSTAAPIETPTQGVEPTPPPTAAPAPLAEPTPPPAGDTPPRTGFEETGGERWTSLSQEREFLRRVSADTSALLHEAGRSVEGRPLWRVDVGEGAEATMLVTALLHGGERAGREAALQLVRDLAYTSDPATRRYLATRRVVVMPTVNPDGYVRAGRRNAAQVDINRDHFALTQPETRALHAVLGDTGAHLVLDTHEFGGFVSADRVQYRRPELRVHHPAIHRLGDDLMTALARRLDARSIPHGLYPLPVRPITGEAAALRHALGFSLETNRAFAPAVRVADQRFAMAAVKRWHDANATALQEMAAASRTFQRTTQTQYVLERGEGRPPWQRVPLPSGLTGYQLERGLPERVRRAYGIAVEGRFVPLRQPARAVLPILLDPQSDDRVGVAERTEVRVEPATRLLTSRPPAVVSPRAPVVLTGRLVRRDGSALAGQQVHIMARRQGDAVRRLATRTTDRDGEVQVTLRPSRTTRYQLRYAGGPTSGAATGSVREVAVR